MKEEAKRFKELNRFSENAKNEFNTIISKLFKNAFTTHFEKALKENRPPEKKEIETFSIEAVETAEDKALFDFTQRVLLLSLLLGNEHADRRVQLADDDFGIGASFGVPSKDALAYLKSQIPVTKEEYAELERKVQFRAFTVSKLAEADFVNKAKMSLIDGIEHSKSFPEIWDEFKKIGSEAGVDISAGYFETVYRTNIQSAYNAGRLMRYKNNPPPAWELLFMEDGNMSEICTALMNEVGGKAIKSDDPFWSTVGFPPYHYNCRTTFRAVYDYELNEGEIDLDAPKERDPLDNGFGGNPLEKESWWKLTDTMLKRAKEYGLKDSIEAMAKKCGVKDFTFRYLRKARKPIRVSSMNFMEKMNAAKKSVRKNDAWRVDIHNKKEYDTMQTYVTRGGSCVAVKSNGDIVSVCKRHGDKGVRGDDLLIKARKLGGIKLDSYDGNHDFYIKNGFEPISWCKFDKQYAPSGWNGKEEDIVFYVYTGNKNSISLHDFKNKIPYSADYDTAQKTRDDLIVGRLKKWKIKK